MHIYFAPEALLSCIFSGGYCNSCMFIEERKQDTGDTSYLSQNRGCHPRPGSFRLPYSSCIWLIAFLLCEVSCMQPDIYCVRVEIQVHGDKDCSSRADNTVRVHVLPITSTSMLTRYVTRKFYTKEISVSIQHITSTGVDFRFSLKNAQNIQPQPLGQRQLESCVRIMTWQKIARHYFVYDWVKPGDG